jgi:hypothetical protein
MTAKGTETDDARIRRIVEETIAANNTRPDGTLTALAVKCSAGVYLIAYESRDPAWVFVPDPCKRGRFCRVPRHFLFNGCPACGALPGQPCHGSNGSWSGMTGHGDRQEREPFKIHDRTFYKSVRKTHGKHDDRTADAAVEALTQLAQSPGYSITATHAPGCASVTAAKKRRSCDCGQPDRDSRLRKILKQLPRLNRQ